MKPIYYFLFFVAYLTACSSQKKIATTQPLYISKEGKLFAAVYQQRAAEYHALCLQAYNIAHQRVDEALRSPAGIKTKAIITDIDETIFDNSANEVHRDLLSRPFDAADWNKWTSMAASDTVPGALSFLKYASSKNIEIFYITNRDENDRAGTLQNLQRFNFPNADNAHLFVRQNTTGKEARRQLVMADHDVILLLGDNLSDFSQVFDRKSYEERLLAAQQQAGQFGNRFIVLPNPVYGDWEAALYKYNFQLTPAQKDSTIRTWLKTY